MLEPFASAHLGSTYFRMLCAVRKCLGIGLDAGTLGKKADSVQLLLRCSLSWCPCLCESGLRCDGHIVLRSHQAKTSSIGWLFGDSIFRVANLGPGLCFLSARNFTHGHREDWNSADVREKHSHLLPVLPVHRHLLHSTTASVAELRGQHEEHNLLIHDPILSNYSFQLMPLAFLWVVGFVSSALSASVGILCGCGEQHLLPDLFGARRRGKGVGAWG